MYNFSLKGHGKEIDLKSLMDAFKQTDPYKWQQELEARAAQKADQKDIKKKVEHFLQGLPKLMV